jgi:predicted Zn-dependent protease
MKTVINYLTFLLLIIAVDACQKVPITGRRQLKLLPDNELSQMGLTNYAQFLTENPALAANTSASQQVSKVGRRISDAVDTFLVNTGRGDLLSSYKWEYKAVESKEVNAWCMPGGKMVVYTALLPVTKDDAGLAVVLGHEVAHAIANHGNERMSQQLLVQLGGIGLALALQQQPQQTQQIFNQAYGIGGSLGVLAYSRTHELEADRLGLVFMAMAGYNPERALSFWTDMSKASATAKPPELISTHPSDEHRITDIQKYIPEAMTYYRPVTDKPVGKPTVKAPPAVTRPSSNSKQIKPGTLLPASPGK